MDWNQRPISPGSPWHQPWPNRARTPSPPSPGRPSHAQLQQLVEDQSESKDYRDYKKEIGLSSDSVSTTSLSDCASEQYSWETASSPAQQGETSNPTFFTNSQDPEYDASTFKKDSMNVNRVQTSSDKKNYKNQVEHLFFTHAGTPFSKHDIAHKLGIELDQARSAISAVKDRGSYKVITKLANDVDKDRLKSEFQLSDKAFNSRISLYSFDNVPQPRLRPPGRRSKRP